MVRYLSTFAGLPVVDFFHGMEDFRDTVEDEIFGLSFAAELRALAQRLQGSDDRTAEEIELFVQRLRGRTHEVTQDRLAKGRPVAWRVATDGETPFGEVLELFLHHVDTFGVTALVIGFWGPFHDGNTPDPVNLLVKVADRFPELRALFLGDIEMEQQEISWIMHSDVTPLFEAFPRLERFEVRGSGGLRLRPIQSEALKVLRFESGGLPAHVVRSVAASDLPGLERLDLWLGAGWYGGDATVADLAPILGGERLPALRHLGLEDSELQDEIAATVAGAPIVAQLESLSLAMGVLTDDGVESLLFGQPLTHLKKLDLHHHYLSDTMIERVRVAHADVQVDLSERVHLYEGYEPYVAVAE